MPEDRIIPWGQSWNPGIKMSRGLDCPSCGWGLAVQEESLKRYNQIKNAREGIMKKALITGITGQVFENGIRFLPGRIAFKKRL